MSRSMSPAKGRYPKAPTPSPALLAMQQKGLELPGQKARSVSPASITNIDPHLRVSPLSILSVASNTDHAASVNEELWKSRKSSLASIETTVTGILNLYTNISQRSLRSEYEEVSPLEDSDDEDLPQTVHQPKAYRDTIAPLLEYQFKSELLAVPPVPSPVSVASLPHLTHPNQIPPLRLSPKPSPEIVPNGATKSQTSIQITPEMTPPPTIRQPMAPSFQEYSASLRERKVALEVPDVRDAGSWYDQPLSPVSPEENMQNPVRASHYSAVSPDEMMRFQRESTYSTFAPAVAVRTCPDIQSAASGHDDYLTEPLAAKLNDNNMLPPFLSLTHSRSTSKVSEGSAPVHTTEVSGDGDLPKSQHASLVAQDPIEGPMRSYLTPPPMGPGDVPPTKRKENLSVQEIYRPGSAFSDDSSEASPNGFGDHLKNAFKFGKKKKASKDLNKTQSKRTSDTLQDNLESYRYSYWKGRSSVAVQDAQATRRDSELSGPGPSVSTSPQPETRPPLRRYEAQPAIPLTDFQMYGPEIYDPKLKEERLKREAKEAKVAEKAAKKQAKAAVKAGKHHTYNHDRPLTADEEFRAQNPHLYDYYKTRPASSRAYSHMKSDSGGAIRPASDAGSVKSSRKSGGTYNNELFEASGGRKKRGVMSRLIMSSEERRRQKVKQSITIVGGGKLNMERPKTTEGTGAGAFGLVGI